MGGKNKACSPGSSYVKGRWNFSRIRDHGRKTQKKRQGGESPRVDPLYVRGTVRERVRTEGSGEAKVRRDLLEKSVRKREGGGTPGRKGEEEVKGWGGAYLLKHRREKGCTTFIRGRNPIGSREGSGLREIEQESAAKKKHVGRPGTTKQTIEKREMAHTGRQKKQRKQKGRRSC